MDLVVFIEEIPNEKLHFLCSVYNEINDKFRFQCSGVFIVNFEQISHLDLVFLLLTLSR